MTKSVAIVQARMGSTRLPGKVMKPINGVPMIEILLKRLAKSNRIDQVIVATSASEINQPLIDHVRGLSFVCELGSETDVLNRYVNAAKKHQADVVVRITGDCPLVDPVLVDDCIAAFFAQGVDYLSNIDPPTYPDGLDIEVMKFFALERAQLESSDPFDHEHVTPFIRTSPKFLKGEKRNPEDSSG